MVAENDSVSSELRKVEEEIDGFYLNNPLTKVPFAEAAWYFLALCEQISFEESFQPGTLQEEALSANQLAESMKWPLRWLKNACASGGTVPRKFDRAMHRAAQDLLDLAQQYDCFDLAFTYASNRLIRLELDGNTIKRTHELREDLQYEAYDRLVKPEFIEDEGDLLGFIERIANTVRVSGEEFSYELNPRIVNDGLSAFAPELAWKTKLPDDWQLSRYTLGDFHRVVGVLYTVSQIHFYARLIAAKKGCTGSGYKNSLIIWQREEAHKRLARYAGLNEATISAIVEDLTYGERGVSQPDPVLQPIIRVSESQYCIPPSLVQASAHERNLITLINKLPDERKTYGYYSGRREGLSRLKIQTELANHDLRMWQGRIPGWDEMPDIDLAIISDKEKSCLLLELKSFIEPAEVREIIDRSKEISRGIQQVLALQRSASQGPTPLRQALSIDESYELTWAIASETSVGNSYVQNKEVPVVRTDHLLRKIKSGISLQEVCSWLESREYLPTEGAHYCVEEIQAQIGHWLLPWQGIRFLVEGEYL